MLICWSIVTTLIFFGPLAYFDLLGKIPDSNDETVEMREIVATNETFKKGTYIEKSPHLSNLVSNVSFSRKELCTNYNVH